MRRRFSPLVSAGVACALLTSTFVSAQVEKKAAKVAAPRKAEAAGPPRDAVKPGDRPPPAKEEMKKAEAPAEEAKDRPRAMFKGVRAAVKVQAAQPAQVVEVVPTPVIPNLDPMIQQFRQQFRPALRAEYSFLRTVCAPTKEERKQIARDGEQALKDAARAFAEFQQNPRRQARGRNTPPDARKLIQEGLAESVKAHLSAEQSARYRTEAETRDESRKQAAVRNLVAWLDQDLVLSPDQRNQLAESLSTHWQDSWCPSLEMLMYDQQNFPNIPDKFVSPFLTETQKRIWKSTPKNQGVVWGGIGIIGGVMDDRPLEDAELEEERKLAPLPGEAMQAAPVPVELP